jgi:uncharacterized protein (UPF0261 family)
VGTPTTRDTTICGTGVTIVTVDGGIGTSKLRVATIKRTNIPIVATSGDVDKIAYTIHTSVIRTDVVVVT